MLDTTDGLETDGLEAALVKIPLGTSVADTDRPSDNLASASQPSTDQPSTNA